MSIDRSILDSARRIAWMLYHAEHKIFEMVPGGTLEQRLDRILAAGGDVDAEVYKLAYLLKAKRVTGSAEEK